MIIISYDIQNDMLRTKFNKYICKFGGRLQYSVYEIENSDTVLDNIIADITGKFEKKFSEHDSIMIFKLSKMCEIKRFGYAKHDEEVIMII